MIVAELAAVLGLQVDQAAWNRGEQTISRVKSSIGTLAAAVGLAFGAHEIVHAIETVADLGDHAVKAAQKLGITAEAVQELGYAAKKSDVDQGELEISLTHLARSLQEVHKGEGPASDAFKKLGLSAQDPAVKAGNLDGTLMKLADRFAAMPDGATKTALAMDLFGKSGAQLIPLLDSGSAGIKELREEATRLGIVIKTPDAKRFEVMNDAVTALKARFEGVRNAIIVAVLPALEKIVDGATRFFDYLSANKDVAEAGLLGIAGAVAVIAAPFLTAAAAALGFGAAVVGAVVIGRKMIEMFRNGGTIMKIAIGAVAVAVGALIVAFAPISMTIAAIGAGVLAIAQNWDDVKKAILAAGEAIRNMPVIKQVIDAGEAIGKGIQLPQLGAGGAQRFGSPLALPPGAGGGNTVNNVSPATVNVTVNAGSNASPDQIAKVVGDHVQQHWNETYDTVRGGRR